jgi:hypothetical protein
VTRAPLLSAALLLLFQYAPPPAPPPAARVVAAVAAATRENAALPEAKRVAGDALADHYVRRAAAAAGGDVRAFLVGAAHAVDPKGALAAHPVTAASFRGLETAEEAKARREALGTPSLRGRNDLLLHFLASAAVAALAGPVPAEAGGIGKEVADSRGGSGFSFADLAADLAGIRFAAWLLDPAGKGRLDRVAKGFAGEEFLPDVSKEPEGLAEAEFTKSYVSTSDEKFRAKVKCLKEAVAALAVYREDAPPR